MKLLVPVTGRDIGHSTVHSIEGQQSLTMTTLVSAGLFRD